MKMLAVIGTNRHEGTIQQLCQRILSVAEAQGHETELVNLYDYTINDCMACFQCRTLKRCIQQDDFETLYRKLEAADVILLGSPVYFGSLSGKMKTFFDRHLGYVMYNPPDALQLNALPLIDKFKALIRELRRFGPRDPNMRGKRFVLVCAATLPFPFSFLTGEIRLTLGCMQAFVTRLRGRRVAKLVYTDTLIRFLKHKPDRLMRKAEHIGELLLLGR